jgi:hypothetical protein
MDQVVDQRGDEDRLAGAGEPGHAEAERGRDQPGGALGERGERQPGLVGDGGKAQVGTPVPSGM